MVVSFSPSMFAVSLTLTSLLPIECPIEILLVRRSSLVAWTHHHNFLFRRLNSSKENSRERIVRRSQLTRATRHLPGLSGPCPFICLR